MLHRVQQTARYLGSPGADDRHATETAATLRQLGAAEELVVARILHDAAKPAHTLLWHRVAGVLLEVTPRVRARLARGDSTFARYLDHARRGAEMARNDGASERVVGLIARHHQRPMTKDERLLARADREARPWWTRWRLRGRAASRSRHGIAKRRSSRRPSATPWSNERRRSRRSSRHRIR